MCVCVWSYSIVVHAPSVITFWRLVHYPREFGAVKDECFIGQKEQVLRISHVTAVVSCACLLQTCTASTILLAEATIQRHAHPPSPPKPRPQAEAVRARVPNRRLFYCALDYRGAQDRSHLPGANDSAQISHWGFQRALLSSVGGGGGSAEKVGDALARQQGLSDSARISLAFLTREIRLRRPK